MIVDRFLNELSNWHAHLTDDTKTILIAVLSVVAGIVFIMAAMRRVVFYYNYLDVFLSMLIVPILLSGFYFSENTERGEAILITTLAASALTCIASFWYSIKYNNILIGLIVGVLKIIIGAIMLLTILGAVSSYLERKNTDWRRHGGAENRTALALLIMLFMVIFGLIWKFLVNGKEVEEHRSQQAQEAK